MHPYFLTFQRPFALAHGTREGTQLAFVKLESQGVVAYGEASLPPYLHETFESVKNWVNGQYEQVKEALMSDPFTDHTRIPHSAHNPAASAALQAAVLRWFAASEGFQLSEKFPGPGSKTSLSLTLTKGDHAVLDEKLELADRFTHIKLKLTGSEDDLDFVKSIRERTSMPFCIDVNQGFQGKEEALRTITALEVQNCVLIEQPLNAQDHEGHNWLKQRTPLPIIADESIRNLEELKQCHEAYSGVNIKLMKCGGLFQAVQMLDFIEESDWNEEYLRLLGCMSESSLGVSTSALLAPRFEMADLDAPYISKNDPFEGFRIEEGKIHLDEKISLRRGIKLAPTP